MSYTNIATALVTICETITEISEVYDHEPKELINYPAIAISSLGHEDAPADTARNRRTFTFNIRCYVRADETSEATLRSLADKIIDAIEGDVTIGGSCDFAKPSRGQFTYPPKEIPVQAVEIKIDAVVKVSR